MLKQRSQMSEWGRQCYLIWPGKCVGDQNHIWSVSVINMGLPVIGIGLDVNTSFGSKEKEKTRTHVYHLQMRTIKLVVCHTTLRRWWSYMFHRHTWRLHLIRSIVVPLSHSLTKPHPVQNLYAIVFCSQWVKHSRKLSLANPNSSMAHMTQIEFRTTVDDDGASETDGHACNINETTTMPKYTNKWGPLKQMW